MSVLWVYILELRIKYPIMTNIRIYCYATEDSSKKAKILSGHFISLSLTASQKHAFIHLYYTYFRLYIFHFIVRYVNVKDNHFFAPSMTFSLKKTITQSI